MDSLWREPDGGTVKTADRNRPVRELAQAKALGRAPRVIVV